MLPLVSRWLPVALVGMLAFWLRTHDLARRPMHADEANQAVKLGELVESHHYAFDPQDHHGPTLYYAALPLAWARGERSLAELSETTVRLVPAIFGTLAVLLVGALAMPPALSVSNGVERWPALAAATFMAVSPPAVYYSRYFIQETLLVTFTLAAFFCVQLWARQGRLGWALAAGCCFGLMLATKANAALFIGAALVALLAIRRDSLVAAPRVAGPAIMAVGVALVTAALLYSSFGTNPTGLRDAISALGHGIDRMSGPSGHEKPWWYYLRLFAWQREGGLVWEQVAFSLLALGGAGIAIAKPPSAFFRWTVVYTLVVIVALSLSPYKTPWHSVHFVPGLSILAAGALAAVSRLPTGKIVASAFAFVTLTMLGAQTWRIAFVRPADSRNPYAYVHSSPDVLKYRPIVAEALTRTPEQPVRVISEEYWPLPWYLRGLPRIGYWPAPPENCDGALLIVSATQAEAVRARLHGRYQESILGLRPGFICVVFTPLP